MPGTEHSPVSGEARVEARDVEVRGIFWFVAALLISGVVITIVLWGIFRFFEGERVAQDPEYTPVVAEQRRREPPSADPAGRFPQPRLQFKAAEENARQQFAEERLLSSYGWVDARAGVARIPIDRAMDLVAERGLPARAEGTREQP